MAAQPALHKQRCGACAQSFRLRPERVAVPAHSTGASHAACCPFCGFLNRPLFPATPPRTTITLVRPPEPEVQPVRVPKAAAVSGQRLPADRTAPWRRPARPLRPAQPRPVFGAIFQPTPV